jgi:hypothetical protein
MIEADFLPTPVSAGATNIATAPSTAVKEPVSSSGVTAPDSVRIEVKSPDPLAPFGVFPDMLASAQGGAEPDFITPQMMFPFFQRRSDGTNLISAGIIGSVLFSPPRAATNLTSKAAYSAP